jgi:hypothetical protein
VTTTRRRGGRPFALLLLPLLLSLLAPATAATAADPPDRLDAFGTAADHGTPPASAASRLVGMAAHPGGGYWVATSNGGVYSYGGAPFHGSAGNVALRSPVVGMAARPDGSGYWLAAADGGIFSFGAATFRGSLGATTLRSPIVGVAATRSGNGYWMVAADGGVFTFGDAVFAGSLGDRTLNAPIVAMAAAPGGGYWLAAADGGVFTFGSATFHGSAGDLRLRHPVVSMAAVPDGSGYWLAGADGGVFTFGTARFLGVGAPSFEPVTTIASRGSGGYWLLRSPLRAHAAGPALPPNSGSGRRVVYSNPQQRVWLVGTDGVVERTYAVSGRRGVPAGGTYRVFSKSRYTSAGHDGITMGYMVRFAWGQKLAIGFHDIPRDAQGRPLQTEDDLGGYRSAGCVRQATADAIYLWDWAPVGTTVVVVY